MRTQTSAVVGVLLVGSTAFAAEHMAPSDIQAAFFNAQPFTASTPGGIQFKMVFTPDGKMTREPFGPSGHKGRGTWKLDATGFCTSWARANATCFTVIPSGKNKGVGEKRRERSRDMDQISNSGPFAVRQPIGRRVALRLVVKIEIAECLPDCVVDDERLRVLFDSLRPREAARGRLRCSPRAINNRLCRSTNSRYCGFGSGFII